jgi:hypothetical protein
MTSTRTARDLLAGLHLNLTQIYRASHTLLADLATDLRYLRSDLATDTRDLYASIRADAADWRDRHAAHRKGLCGTAPTAYQTAAYAIPEWWRCNETRRHYPATAHQTASGGQWGHGPATTEPTPTELDEFYRVQGSLAAASEDEPVQYVQDCPQRCPIGVPCCHDEATR